MPKWEYIIHEALSMANRDSAFHEMDELNKLGAEGWEMTAWIERPSEKGLWGWFVLKRPLA